MVDSALLSSIVEHGLWRRDRTRLLSSRGGTLDWLIDLRAVFLRKDCLEHIVAAFQHAFSDSEPRQIGGMETAAIPLLTALLLHSPETWGNGGAVIIRKERKTTGLGRMVEGRLSGLPVMLVDDILNSGSSAEKARAAIEAAGGRVTELFVVIDFRSQKGIAWQRRTGIKVTSLFTLDDFGLVLRPNPPSLPQQYRMRWRREIEGGNPFHVVPKSGPVLVGDRVYRGSDAALLQAFDAATGDLTWSFKARGASSGKGIWSTPAWHAGRLYFGAYNGMFYCLEAATGREIWSQALGDWIGASPLIVPQHSLVYVGVEYERAWAQGSMTALDLDTGSRVWERRSKRYQHGSAAYYAGGDLVIWGSADHETLACRARDGEVVWRFPTERSVKCAPAIDEAQGLCAFASFDQAIYLIEALTGRALGRWETDGLCYTTPLFARGKLFCGSGDRKFYVIDVVTRSLIKTFDAGARVYSSPVLVGESVLFGTTGGKVFEMSVDSLDIVGVFQLSDAVTNAVAAAPDGRTLYVSTAMNALVCVERI